MNQVAQLIPTISSNEVVHSTCPYCGVGCGVTAQQTAKGLQVVGDESHPANRGKLCIKGSNLADTVGMSHRLITPQHGRGAARKQTSWDQATDLIADKFRQCIDQYGRESVAFYVSGQLLTEDYYVVNKFVKGYLGTGNIDTNSRLCMSSAVAAHKRAFGEDVVAGNYQDFEQAELIVLVGSNTAWCHPILFQRIMAAKAENTNLKVVVIDPRFTATCEQADLHLPILIGQDICLFNGLLQYLNEQGYADQAFIDAHTTQLDRALDVSQAEQDLDFVASETGIAIEKLLEFYQLFAKTKKVITLFSMGVNQSSQGTNKANSIINCHLLTGRVTGEGMGAFSITGQPNAMGGREVGGLANMLASHLDIDNPSHQQLVQDFWQSPHIAQKVGLKAVDMFEAVEAGKIKAIWIMATNPVVSLPNSDQVKRALEKCEFVVVSDVCKDTDTTDFADVLLPAQAWGEKDGTVTNSERRISRQNAFLSVPETIKADWWAVSQVAQKLGWQGFDFNSNYDIFLEHAKLSTIGNGFASERDSLPAFRYFNLQGLSDISQAEYNALKPIQWPVYADKQGMPRIYGDGIFSHADSKAKFIATPNVAPKNKPNAEYPLILNTGRVRDQWHTMSRTGLSANLSTHRSEPYCEIHPQDALKFGIKEFDLVEVRSEWGRCIVRGQFSTKVRRGQIFVPIHWNDQVASDARVGAVVNPVVDAISGEPEFKHTPVMIQPFYGRWQGVLYVRPEWMENAPSDKAKGCDKNQWDKEGFTWWVKIQTAQAIRYEIVDRTESLHVANKLQDLLPYDAENDEWLMYEDVHTDTLHIVVLREDRLMAAFYLAPREFLPDRDWLAGLFSRNRLSALHRRALLAGMPIGQANNEGALVCSCFKVGKNRIIETIKTKNLTNEKQVTACLKAGGNCGSCLPEIRGLIKQCQSEHESELSNEAN